MSRCPSCGGIVGRDCFNPQECAEIGSAQEQEARRQEETSRHEYEAAVRGLFDRVEELEREVRDLREWQATRATFSTFSE